MIRKTLQTLVVVAGLSAAAASPSAWAYFAVSVPGSAITMSGTPYGPPSPAAEAAAPTPLAQASAESERRARTAEARQVKRSLLRALFLPGL